MVNKVFLVGNLGQDPESLDVNGTSLTKFSLATTKRWVKDGEKKEETSWHRVQVWGKLAGACGKYLTKGSKVYLEGELKYGSYDKDGTTVYTTDVVANSVQFLDSKKDKADVPNHANDLPF